MRLQLAPSPALAAIIVGAHALAGLAAWIVLPTLAGAMLAAALLALGVAAAWSRALLGAARSLKAIEISGERVAFELRNGERVEPAGAGRRYVTRHLVALPPANILGRTMLVTAGMLPAGQFRRLRIWALWNRLPPDGRKELFHGRGVYGS
jgi:hypothetical protein